MRHIRIAALAVIVTLLAGCAASEYKQVVDRDQMIYVGKAQRSSPSNIRVYWINPPRKRVKRKTDEAAQSDSAQ